MAVRKASTIGNNPLDQVVTLRRQEAVSDPEPETTKVARDRVTIALPADLMDRVRNAVYWTPGATLVDLVESAVADAMDRLALWTGLSASADLRSRPAAATLSLDAV